MKLYLTLFCMLIVSCLNATNYYFSIADGNDSRTSLQAQSSSTPWQSITKLNAVLSGLASNDSVLFKAGETFVGSITANLKSDINYGRYGTGVDPIITGYSTLTSWTNSATNIYYATLNVPYVQIVTIDGTIRGKGRYPNTTYIQYTSHVVTNIGGSDRNTSITGAGISAIPFNPATGTVVIRKARYYVDGQRITSRSSTTLNLDYSDIGNGYPGGAPPSGMDGNGSFIIDHIGTLDQDGEWFYDDATDRLYIYSTTNPSGRVVKAGGIQIGVDASFGTNISFSNLKLTGYNATGILLDGEVGFKLKNCTLIEMGQNAVQGDNGSGDSILNNIFRNCLNSALIFGGRGSQAIIGNTIDSISLIMGMSKSGDAAGNAIHFGFGTTPSLIKNNSITNVGFNAISSYAGSDWTVEQNYINGYCLKKDDGGAIYQYGISSTAKSNRIVRYNIILNGPGSMDGLGFYTSFQNIGQAYGIYMDNFADHVNVNHNFVANSSGGSLHNSSYCNFNTYDNNILFNGGALGMLILDLDGISIHDLVITNNTFISYTDAEPPMYIEQYGAGGGTSINHFGVFNNNMYAIPTNPTARVVLVSNRTGGLVNTAYTLAQWQSTWSKDLSSTTSAITISDPSVFRTDVNPSTTSLPITLGAQYKDVSNVIFTALNLAGYTGSVLTYYAPTSSGSSSTKTLVIPSKVLILPNGRVLQIPQ